MSKRKPRSAANGGNEAKGRSAASVIAAVAPPPEPGIAVMRGVAVVDWLPPLLLIIAGLGAYVNSFEGAFLLDDKPRIIGDPQIRRLWPPWILFAGNSRPVVQLSLAANYALGGINPWGYHAFNLAIHLAAGLLLFGIVRRMLESERLRARFGSASRWLALAVAGLWLVHPLQTESVTYVIQRAESLMGMFYLLTLYCGIRACASPQPRRWSMAAIVACALGMGSKEVMVTAPLLMLLYDRTFVAGSFAGALRQRRGLYAGLAATWLVLAAALANRSAAEQQVFLVTGHSPWSYLLTQSEVIVHYLRLALWPQPLILDYAWPIADPWWSVAPAALVVLALLGGTVLALRRATWIGFWGAWFFLILAPTSSILPIADVAFEHRMYLPLAAVAAVLVIGGYRTLEVQSGPLRTRGSAQTWLGAALVVIASAALGHATVRRNDDYRSELAMWRDTVAKRPGNARARVNLGIALKAQGKLGEAMAQYGEALRLRPNYAEAHNNLGNAFAIQGKRTEAIAQWNEALRQKPDYVDALLNLGIAASNQGQAEEAIARFRAALRIDPDHAGAHNNLGMALASQGKLEEAAARFADAVRLDPGFVWARDNLRRVETVLGREKAVR